jgi:hypothetical protein
MPANKVDLVLVVDASSSMSPCYQALCEHLDSLLAPLLQASFDVRIGVLASSASASGDFVIHHTTFLAAEGMAAIRAIYGSNPDPSLFFTSNPADVRRVLRGIEVRGNEDMLVALDIALDLPFRPAWETRRVVVLLTDEPFDSSASDGASVNKLPLVIEKLMARRVKLFLAAPSCSAADELACADGVEWETIDSGHAGLAGVDFTKLLGQMAKTISGHSRQGESDDYGPRPSYGQDQWTGMRQPFETM